MKTISHPIVYVLYRHVVRDRGNFYLMLLHPYLPLPTYVIAK